MLTLGTTAEVGGAADTGGVAGAALGVATRAGAGAAAGPKAGAGPGAGARQGSDGASAQTAVQLPDVMAFSVVASTTVQPLQTASDVDVRLSVTHWLPRMAAVRLLTKLPSRW